jgi:type 1 glutamine amidotransferase
MTKNHWLPVIAGVAGLVLRPGTGNTQDWAQIRTGAASTVSFRVAVPLANFREMTFLESLERTGLLRVPNLEASSTQKVGGSVSKILAPGLSPEEIAVVKGALRNRKIAAYSIPAIPGEEAAARELFQFARALNVETIISAPPEESLALIDRLASEFNIKVALVNSGVAGYRSPKSLRKLLDTRSERVGACADLGNWQRDGVRALDGVAALQDRVIAVRLAGTRAEDWKDLFLALYHQKARPAIYTFEPAASGDAVADLSAKLEAYETALTPVMSEYVAELGRSTAIRTLDAQPRLTAAQKTEAMQKMDAAIPAQPQASPRKPRKLLVIDLQVGYPGHPSIPYANYMLEHYGRKTGAWEPTFSNDLANFQYAKLRQYDAVFLNNTVGMLFADPEVRANIVRFLKEGGGLAGYHASTHASIDWPEFTEIIGASSGAHREATEKVTVKLDDPASPINAAFAGQEFESIDEHFRWSNYSRQRVHVLLSIDVPKTDLNQGRGCDICTRADGDYAISWVHSYGKGRVFYSSLGHAPTAFMDTMMVRHIMAGVQFALGDLDADTTPGNQPAGK